MATTSRVDTAPTDAARRPGVLCLSTPRPAAPPPRRREPAGVPAPRAPGSASLSSLRWAIAFYGGFYSAPVGMAFANWFG